MTFLTFLLDADVNNTSWSNSVGQLFYLVIVLILICALAYYAIKWMARARNVKSGNLNMKVLEAVSVGQAATVQLVKAGEKYIVIGVTKERVTFLTEMTEDELEQAATPPGGGVKMPFEKYFNQILRKPGNIQKGDKKDEESK